MSNYVADFIEEDCVDGCGDVRQIERKMTDPEDTYICTACHNEFRRKWSSPPVTFKGNGWGSQ